MKRVRTELTQWEFRAATNGLGIDNARWRSVSQFPTNIHLDLLAPARSLEHNDPFMGKNESSEPVRLVGEQAWVYRTSFPTPVASTGEPVRPRFVLVFEGLDTIAHVELNGNPILHSDNMFVSHRVDVSDMLKSPSDFVYVAENGVDMELDQNELLITFESADHHGRRVVESHPDHKWGCWNGDISRLGVRKAQYHWGWDWGPKLITCGPWKPVALEVYTAHIADLHGDVAINSCLDASVPATVRIRIRCEIQGSASTAAFVLRAPSGDIVDAKEVKVSQVGAQLDTIIDVPDAQLWYPRGYGAQPLYTIRATIRDSEGSDLDVDEKRIGLRHSVLVQDKLSSSSSAGDGGSTFFFQINGIPIFCGGSNWIPADSFLPRLTADKYRDWIGLVADGNQKMIRVWGGGVYEDDALYDACDELGILVWQDFMFACGNYPAHADFLASVEREAEANVRRLRHHPSIVIWAGNNEDYLFAEGEGLRYDPDDKDPPNWLTTEFPARYIYEKVLPEVCMRLMPKAAYHPGSPWGGKPSGDASVGDMHQWNVWHGSQERYQDYERLRGRFVSEFGMEAFPAAKTTESYLLQGASDPERRPSSSTVDFHNKATGHERRLALYLVENVGYPGSTLKDVTYMTQLVQAEALSAAIKAWRRYWNKDRECGGALIWQANDCWPTTSWSLCDYYLRPKAAYYAVKRELAPITVSLKLDISDGTEPQGPTVWASNLTLEHVGVLCTVHAYDIQTGICSLEIGPLQLELAPNTCTPLALDSVELSAPTDCTLATVYTVILSDTAGNRVASHVRWPEPLKHVQFGKPSLTVAFDPATEELVIDSGVPAKGVWIEAEDDIVRFEDNMIDVIPREGISRIRVRGATAATKFTAMAYPL